MKFVELHLDGFGKLVDRTFRFAPGLNLVYGPNEAGKSTLQQALIALLYGFYEEGSVTRAKRETARMLTPWTAGVDFAGWLIFKLDDNREFRVARSFSGRPTTRLETTSDGQDVSSEYQSASYGRLFFADTQLGVSKTVFENTCMVHQAELIALEGAAGAITDTLVRLSSSASQDTTTADALALLDKALRDDVGSDRAWTKPLAQARQRLEDLHTSQQKTAEIRREAFALMSELRQEQEQLEDLDLEIERLDYLATLAEWQATRERLEVVAQTEAQVKELATEVDRLKPWAEFPAHLRDEVIRLHAECNRLTRAITARSDHMATVQSQRMTVIHRLNSLEKEVEELADARDVATEQLPDLQKLAVRWQTSHTTAVRKNARLVEERQHLARHEEALAKELAVLGPVISLGSVGLAQLQQRWSAAYDRANHAQAVLQQASADWQNVGLTDEQYEHYAETALQIRAGTYVEKHPRRGCRFWGRSRGVRPSPPEAAIYAQVKPIRDRWEMARADVDDAVAKLGDVEQKVRHYLSLGADQRPTQAHFEATSRSLASYAQLSSEVRVHREAVDRARTDVDNARSEASKAREALVRALADLKCETADPEVGLRSFERLCRQKARYDRADVELQKLRDKDRLLAREEEAQRERQEDLSAARQALCITLDQADIKVTKCSLADAVADFVEQARHHELWRRAQDRYETALGQLRRELTQQDREAAQSRMTNLEHRLDIWRSTEPEWADLEADHDAHDYRERRREFETSRQAKRERCTQIRESLQRMTTGLAHPAELAEEIALAEADVRRLQYLRHVLSLAREELIASTEEYQRAFAPRLERLVADGLERVTEGRYSQVNVDPRSLGVTLRVPERAEPVKAELLSTGTRELVYLLLRIAVARLMSRTHETLPLLLDDPLVQLDRDRQQRFLRLLTRLTEETQVILLTKDDELLSWAEKELADSEQHRSHTLQ